MPVSPAMGPNDIQDLERWSNWRNGSTNYATGLADEVRPVVTCQNWTNNTEQASEQTSSAATGSWSV